MRIQCIDVFQVDLPYQGGSYRLSGGRSYTSFDATIVRITTECGLQGWGESTPFGPNYVAAHALGVRAGIEEVAPHLLGLDPRRVDRNYEVMDQALVGHPHAKTALDVACWDIFGKAVQMPVCELLGGRTDYSMPLISSIHTGQPEDMRRRVQAHREQGYRGHSIKIGALDAEGGPSLDAQRIIQSLSDAQPGEFFIVDANGGLSVERALRLLKILPSDLDFVLEAPCATVQESLALRQRSSVPIFWDELIDSDQSLALLVSQQAAEGIGLKVSKSGGLTPCRRQRDMCLASGLVMSVQDTVGSEIAFAAVVHLGQSVPEQALRCILDTRDMVSISIATFDCSVAQGGVRAPDEVGLGVSPDLEVLGHPVKTFR